MFRRSTHCLIVIFCVATATLNAQERKEQRPGTPTPAPAGQPQVVQPCPQFNMNATARSVREGTAIKFTAALQGGDNKVVPIYNWSLSAGSITSGQGTPTIDVDTSNSAADKNITASLIISGYAPECPYMAESSVRIVGPARKVHEYGTVTEAQQADWLDRLIAALPADEQAYIIVYAGRNSVRGTAAAEIRKIRAHVTKNGTVNVRMVTLDGGYREEPWFEMWMVPYGAEAPRPTPTINAKDIVFPKTAPTRKP